MEVALWHKDPTGLCRAVWDWASVSQYKVYRSKSWLRNSADAVVLDLDRLHAWICMSALGACLHLCFSVFVSVLSVTGPQWWIQMFPFPVDPPDRSSILKQFGSAFRAWEGREKGCTTQLTAALMKDSLEAPGYQEVSGFTVSDGLKNNMLSGMGGHQSSRAFWYFGGNTYSYGRTVFEWGSIKETFDMVREWHVSAYIW